MKLNPAPFEMMASGKKTIELRLYDEKRRTICAGDTIVFTNSAEPQKRLYTCVMTLHCFDSFAALYSVLPLMKCGYTADNIATAKATDMDAYYTPCEQAKWGVVGIELKLI